MDLRDVREFLLDAGKYIIAIFVLLFIVIYVFSVQVVVGPSMEPGLKENDILFLSKFHYKVFDVKRDDVVAFSDKSSKYLIKRIIGIPGDNLEEYGYETIPEDMYFVLGDNLDDSLDSRDFGLISKSQIIGKPYFKIWPIWEFKFI